MAVQAQYPSNIVLSDFRSIRSGQEHRNTIGLGFGSSEHQMNPHSNHPPPPSNFDMFNTGVFDIGALPALNQDAEQVWSLKISAIIKYSKLYCLDPSLFISIYGYSKVIMIIERWFLIFDWVRLRAEICILRLHICPYIFRITRPLKRYPRNWEKKEATVHGQQVLSTNGAIFHFPEEPSSRKRPREIVDHIPLQQQRPSLINLSDLQQQTGPGIVSHSARTVSTGLRLAFEDEQVNPSTKFVPRLDLACTAPFLSEDVASNLQKQKEEIDQFLRVQGDQLRQALAEKRQRHFRSLVSMIEEAASRQMKEKDLEMDKINLRNIELEEQIKQLKLESCMWQNKVRNQEAVMANLRRSLQQALGQVREQSKEGCGDSEENDAESVHIDPNVRSIRASKDLRDQSMCKICHKNNVSILILPCRHLCICKDCEGQVDTCPMCYHLKSASVEVYMS